MRAGVTADHVTALSELPDLTRVQESARPDVIHGHEEQTDPPTRLQHVCRGHGAPPTIVERDLRIALKRVEVRRECLWRDLVKRSVPPGKPAAVFVPGGDDVVIHQRVHRGTGSLAGKSLVP